MNDLGQALLAKTNDITDAWISAVRQDIEIDSAKGLTYKAVRDSLPLVLEAIATLLTNTFANQRDRLENKSWKHGAVRAEQGYDTTEIMREFRILRNIVFSALEPDLRSGSVDEILQAINLIDDVLDEVIVISLDSYFDERLDEVERVKRQLLLTNQELTRLIRVEKDNLSHLAHELKTPLSAILGFSSISRQQQQQASSDLPSPLDLRPIERVIRNGQTLLRLINNALEVSQNSSGQLELNLESTQPIILIQSVVEALELSAMQKGLALVVDCDRAPQEVLTDVLRTQQILTNLLSNAIRYTDSGEIRITSYLSDANEWVIAVSDTGIGIKPDEQARIFEPYFRARPLDDHDYPAESSGLGLAVVAKLVSSLNGRIDVDSTAGEGSTFTVFLPCG